MRLQSHTPPLGPVAEMVVNDRPRYKSSSLVPKVSPIAAERSDLNARSILLQLVRSLAFCEFNTAVKLFLQPSKVAS